MPNLTLVKSDRSEKVDDSGVPESYKKLHPYTTDPKELKRFYDLSISPSADVFGYFKKKEKELVAIASQELIFIKNSQNLSEGKRRLYDQAAKGFQVFIDSKNIEFDASKEMLDSTYFVLLYYVDKLYPGIEVELDTDNKGLIINENQDPSDRSPRLLDYLIRSWIHYSNLEAITIYGIMLVIFSDL